MKQSDIKFSSRIIPDLAVNPLTSVLQEIRADGRPWLDLTVSNPTCCRLERPDAILLQALTHSRNAIYDPDSKGLCGARTAISSYYEERGLSVDPEDLILTASTSEAYSYVFRLLCDPYDRILIAAPGYPLLHEIAHYNDVRTDTFSQAWSGNGWTLDADELESQIRTGTKAILCVSPNNPTGAVLSEEDRGILNRIASKHGLALIIDEVFADYSLEERGMTIPARIDREVLTFTLNGVSKTLAMPQAKLSWIMVSGPASQKRCALDQLERMADTFLSPGTFAQNALVSWMGLRSQIQNPIRNRLKTNLRELEVQCGQSGEWELLRPDAGWYACIRRRKDARTGELPDFDEEAFGIKLLKESRVWVHPGHFYDFPEDGVLVLSLLTPEKDFREGLGRIVASSQ